MLNSKIFERIQQTTLFATYFFVVLYFWGTEKKISGLIVGIFLVVFIHFNTRRLAKKAVPDERQKHASLMATSLASGVTLLALLMIYAYQQVMTGDVDPIIMVVMMTYYLSLSVFQSVLGGIPDNPDDSELERKVKLSFSFLFLFAVGVGSAYLALTK